MQLNQTTLERLVNEPAPQPVAAPPAAPLISISTSGLEPLGSSNCTWGRREAACACVTGEW